MLEICLGYRGSGKFELRTKVIVGLSGNKGIRGNADADNPELWWQRGMRRCLSRRQTWFYLGSSLLPTCCGDDFFFFFTFFSFPSKDDLPMSCLSFMLTKLTEEETYGKTPFNEDHYVSPLPHTRL